MTIAKVVNAQRDFSSGELDISIKRNDDDPRHKTGARQMANLRILNSRAAQNRPGRRALFVDTGRIEEILMSPGNRFFLCFGSATLTVRDATGAIVFMQTGMPWATVTLGQIVWDVYKLSIYIAFPGVRPKVLTWDGVAVWSLAAFAELMIGNQKRTFFYRMSPLDVTMLPSARTGAGINLTFSSPILTAAHIGTRMRFIGRQVLITAITSPTIAVATVEEPLFGSQQLTFGSDPALIFNVGDVVQGATSGSQGVAVAFPGGNVMNVQLITGSQTIVTHVHPVAFTATEGCVGPGGVLVITAVTVISTPYAVAIWDDEVMNDLRGYPSSVFVDQNRLGFCNFPQLPSAIGWSAIGLPSDMNVDAQPVNAMLELAPGKSQVLYVMAGAESSEFVFCDNAIYYIPITVTNPLKPGSVAFQFLAKGGVAAVQPRAVQEVVLYINAGNLRVMALVATGAYNRPYETRDVSELHAHLFNVPVAIAAPTADATFPERYVYVLNADGTVAVGKYTIANANLKGEIGWVPWSGSGAVKWIAAYLSDAIFTTTYPLPVSIVEVLDDTLYLDGAQSVNAAPDALAVVAISGATGALIGNMVAGGGLAAAFTGNSSQLAAASAGIVAADGYVGKNYATPQKIKRAYCWPSSDSGFQVGGTGAVTIELRAKATAPASSVDGTLLGSVTGTLATPQVIPSNDTATAWAYVWLHVAGTTSTSVYLAAAAFYGPAPGPLWWNANGSVDLMDNGTRMMGTYQIDANGALIPQGNAGENLASVALVAGKAWSATLEPFVPGVQPGQDIGQRVKRRRVARVMAHVQNSSGFMFTRLFATPVTAISPAPGAVMNQRRIPTWNQDDDPTVAPPLREQAYGWRPLGRAYDPRIAIVKDTPGPIVINEIGMEVNV